MFGTTCVAVPADDQLLLAKTCIDKLLTPSSQNHHVLIFQVQVCWIFAGMDDGSQEAVFSLYLKLFGVDLVPNSSDEHCAFLDVGFTRPCALELYSPTLAVLVPDAIGPVQIVLNMSMNAVFVCNPPQVSVHFAPIWETPGEIGLRSKRELVDESRNIYSLLWISRHQQCTYFREIHTHPGSMLRQ